jgi:hypothetical protein
MTYCYLSGYGVPQGRALLFYKVKEARDLYLDGDMEGALSRFALAAAEEGYAATAQANAAYTLERGKRYK